MDLICARTVCLAVLRKQSMQDLKTGFLEPQALKAWRLLAPCWDRGVLVWDYEAIICRWPRLQEVLYVFLESSACSKPWTSLSARRCEVTGTNSRLSEAARKRRKILRQTALKLRHLVHRTRQHLMMRRGLDFARASEVVANVGNLNLFGGTHLVVTLRTCLQVEEKLLEPPKLRGSEPKLWTTFLTHNV